jgi:hypothetical protein
MEVKLCELLSLTSSKLSGTLQVQKLQKFKNLWNFTSSKTSKVQKSLKLQKFKNLQRFPISRLSTSNFETSAQSTSFEVSAIFKLCIPQLFLAV